MNETDYFEIAREGLQDYIYSRKRRDYHKCELCGEIIPWGYISFRGATMCSDCFEEIKSKCKSCDE